MRWSVNLRGWGKGVQDGGGVGGGGRTKCERRLSGSTLGRFRHEFAEEDSGTSHYERSRQAP